MRGHRGKQVSSSGRVFRMQVLKKECEILVLEIVDVYGVKRKREKDRELRQSYKRDTKEIQEESYARYRRRAESNSYE